MLACNYIDTVWIARAVRIYTFIFRASLFAEKKTFRNSFWHFLKYTYIDPSLLYISSCIETTFGSSIYTCDNLSHRFCRVNDVVVKIMNLSFSSVQVIL